MKTRAATMLVGLAVGCGSPSSGGSAKPTPSESAAPLPDFSVRRPSHRYYLGRTRERCEVFWIDEGDVSSKPVVTPCPGDLEVGERIRIAGMTCVRENTRDDARARPVVCPDALTNLEKEERKSRSAPSSEPGK